MDEINSTLVVVSVRECIQEGAIERHQIMPGYKQLPLTRNKETTSFTGSGTDRRERGHKHLARTGDGKQALE